MKRFSLTIVALFVISVGLVHAQAEPIKSHSEFLGYELGDHFTYHHQVVDYFQYVAETSSLVDLEFYGKTNERRPLLTVFISSTENIARREQIRTNNLKRTGVMEGEAEQDNIAIVWLSYNIHGNESVSMEASMQTL